jgi:hypothetical protein
VQRRITGFHQDETGNWVAELECGHQQHVRHNPPWEIRPWVLTEGTRQEKVGAELDCVMCRVPFPSRPRT